jgi:hypothetical protein
LSAIPDDCLLLNATWVTENFTESTGTGYKFTSDGTFFEITSNGSNGWYKRIVLSYRTYDSEIFGDYDACYFIEYFEPTATANTSVISTRSFLLKGNVVRLTANATYTKQ